MNNLFKIHIAVFLFGLAGLFGKLLALPSTIIVLGRVFFAALFLATLLLCTKQSLKLKTKHYLPLALSGVLLAAHWITFFESIQVSTVAIGLLTFSSFPLFVTFLEPIVFKEKIHAKDIIIALITLFGVFLIVPSFDLNSQVTLGVIWGILSGLTFACLSLINRTYVRKYSGQVIAFYQDCAATIVLLPFLFITKSALTVSDILLLLLLGVVFTATAHTIFINGLRTVKAKTASIIATLEPVYGILFAIILVSEIPELRTVIGGMIILACSIFTTIKN